MMTRNEMSFYGTESFRVTHTPCELRGEKLTNSPVR